MNIQVSESFIEHIQIPWLFGNIKNAIVSSAESYTHLGGGEELNTNREIDFYESLFIENRPFKIYFLAYPREKFYSLFIYSLLFGLDVQACDLVNTGNFYEFEPPKPVHHTIKRPDNPDLRRNYNYIVKRDLRRKTPKPVDVIFTQNLNELLNFINNQTIKSVIYAAKNELDFVERFNNEMFKNIVIDGRRLSYHDLSEFYRANTALADLSDADERNSFISLFAMSFYGLSLNEVFTIDSIFSAQTNRDKDNLKKRAGVEVYKIVQRGDKDEIAYVLKEMEKTAEKIPLVPVNIKNLDMLKSNYTVYKYLGNVGRVIKHCLPGNSKAALLAEYACISEFCEEVAVSAGEKSHMTGEAYERVRNLQGALTSINGNAEQLMQEE